MENLSVLCDYNKSADIYFHASLLILWNRKVLLCCDWVFSAERKRGPKMNLHLLRQFSVCGARGNINPISVDILQREKT